MRGSISRWVVLRLGFGGVGCSVEGVGCTVGVGCGVYGVGFGVKDAVG